MIQKNIYQKRILILDFGSQYTQLLARRIREIGIYCELASWHATEQQIKDFHPNGIILSGGPENSTSTTSPRASNYIFDAGVPILGICYGMQIMAIQLGGKVNSSSQREFGYAKVMILEQSSLFCPKNNNIPTDQQQTLEVWMSHCDNVTDIPPDFITIGSTEKCPIAIMVNEKKRFYGVQFHPEVTHTPHGFLLLERFARDICRCETLWTAVNIIDNTIQYLHQKIGNDTVILGLSGGIDSLVTAILLHRAIGDRLKCVFIDNGLLRLNEANAALNMFSHCLGFNIIYVKAKQRFLSALVKIHEPEEKRKIIGRVFIDIFEEEASKLHNITWLAQGTIYPDIIESGMSSIAPAHVIKSHHNVGGLPKYMKLRVVEPLKQLFKDEVRKIGIQLGLPHTAIYKHPFPGPGLGIRILGEIKQEYCELLRCADAILIEELHRANLYHKVNQAFTVFLPIHAVSVMGDRRNYDWVIAIRAVETTDFMTAKWANLSYEFLTCVSTRIMNEIKGISRVVYDISNKPPATIEWE
ncbi:glutamine-hydrolyzing GMP synthase [Candidatus Erwinia haradaeae]|uniref:GMP synthase [glutamine-hydrolyzing] n=1 Tax=Candidatus Erwinia haradaeae TaxID=1922217 RepID=A0A451D9A5_9GAMM|nr:glutamine-hydrolyzing GMP synthase [Candidatus Erwinia haradaeae]VFP82890.1 GMP synthase [glutamine-hydrolyzing] [Candidatus Erwinia haradaeae]